MTMGNKPVGVRRRLRPVSGVSTVVPANHNKENKDGQVITDFLVAFVQHNGVGRAFVGMDSSYRE